MQLRQFSLLGHRAVGEKCGGEMKKAKWKTFNTAGMQDLITNVYVQPELLTTANIHENGLIDQIIISVFKKMGMCSASASSSSSF